MIIDPAVTATGLAGLPRLLPVAPGPVSLPAHIERYGPLPGGGRPSDLIALLERSGLRGRGGAGFPTWRKLAAVVERSRASVIVANGTEGEPASVKDRALLSFSPHAVLDGIALAGRAIGATEAIVCVDRADGGAYRAVVAAVGERVPAGIPVRVERAPSRYLTGEESALVHWLNGGDAKPTFVPPRPFERGVGGRPTLVDNVETLAHLGLIARFGADWFRAIGTADTPGSMLVTVTGAVARPGVLEAACGTGLGELVAAAGGATRPLSAVLVGGYFGTWMLPGPAFDRPLDTTVGAGVVVALPVDACGLSETARLARWLAAQSAHQCGPCLNGLPAISGALDALAEGRASDQVFADLYRWLGLVPGRGACKLPDGVSRLVASALYVFAGEIEVHRGGRCHGGGQPPVLPLPAIGGWR